MSSQDQNQVQSQVQNQVQSQVQDQNQSQDLSVAPPPPRDSPWAAGRRATGERVTTRLRRVAEGLPDWEPLPPGETVVRRPGSLA
ncbi:hypothetical protein ACIBKX_20890 [Streptomyces sp. NPDC050658]|uniref:hypothetical protein n=1 Tax=unclassified Streptomyces TaxID=2593676 RepID=UPI003432D484